MIKYMYLRCTDDDELQEAIKGKEILNITMTGFSPSTNPFLTTTYFLIEYYEEELDLRLKRRISNVVKSDEAE